MKQRFLKSCLVFAGIPIQGEEKVGEIIIAVCSVLGVKISDSDISNCYRQGHQMRVNSRGDPMPPTIMVEFTREQIKSLIIMAVKNAKKTLTTSDIGLSDHPPLKIYINERLTPYNHRILKEALSLKSKNLLKFVWTNGGFVHGRVDSSSPTLSFSSINEIYDKLGTCNPVYTEDPSSALISKPFTPVADSNEELRGFPEVGNPIASVIATKRKSLELISTVAPKITKVSPVIPKRTRGRTTKVKDKDKIKDASAPVAPSLIVDSPLSPTKQLAA